MAHDWSDEDVEYLRELSEKGYTSTEIARQFAVKYPNGSWTRNMIIGKAQRVGISMSKGRNPNARPSAHKIRRGTNRRTSFIRQMGAVPELLVDLDAPTPIDPAVTIATVTEKQCKWPIGDPKTPEFRLCGHPAEIADPYCAYHMKKQYNFNPTKRKRQRGNGSYRFGVMAEG